MTTLTTLKMVTFRLPDFRWFQFFRDRRQKTVFPQYPGPGPIPDQWHQSQSRSEQHPVYFSTFIFFPVLLEIDLRFLPFS